MRLCAFADEASNDLQGQIEALLRNNIGLLEIRGVDGENIKDISHAKIQKIKDELGWYPETDFETGIRMTLQWYKDNEQWWQEILDGSYQNQN